jgi:hypothetical protein
MIAQSFFNKSLMLGSRPDFVIINTRSELNQFCKKMVRYTEPWDVSGDAITDLIVKSLTYEQDALLELQYLCMEVVCQYIGTLQCPEAETISKEIYTLGEEIFRELRDLRVYQNGYLFYQFFKTIGGDIVLIRLVPPNIQ